MKVEQVKPIIEGVLLAAGEPVSLDRIRALFANLEESERPPVAVLKDALAELNEDCQNRGIELKELASGYCYQVKAEFGIWVRGLLTERLPRYSRALLETLAVIAYRQPVTRGEIEDIRGVAVSSSIIKTLHEREWVHIVGHREIPGKPSLYATTKQFLDYFNLKCLADLPVLEEPKDLEQIANQLEAQLIADQPIQVEAESEMINLEKQMEVAT